MGKKSFGVERKRSRAVVDCWTTGGAGGSWVGLPQHTVEWKRKQVHELEGTDTVSKLEDTLYIMWKIQTLFIGWKVQTLYLSWKIHCT